MSKKVVYVGKDLEAMSFAVNYHRWILDEFKNFLGKNVVEVGAGSGSFSEMVLDTKPETLALVEPSDMYKNLKENVSANGGDTKIDFYNAVFAAVKEEITAKQKPDSIIYVNVLEHIEDDRQELKLIYDSLKEGGRCFLFVPALMALYGEFDRKLGHFRRYTKKELEQKSQAAGFKILKSKYFDFAGVIPWYINYRLLKSESMGSGAVSLYDKAVVPVFRKIESMVNVPVGKNVLLIGEK
ncbi:MAG TPA: methyltransferase domain-containing protein [Pyrinomonadaceae bacterium]|nr:methyltransferase domain-containing protein [Pyrinomonadaceae bacterium]